MFFATPLASLASSSSRPGKRASRPTPLPVLVGAKILAHWLLSGLPLALLAPVLALQFDLDAGAMQVLVLSLLLGTPMLMMVKTVCDRVDDLKPIGELLGA